MRLKNRNSQIPNSFRFRIPELKWEATPWASFDVIVRSVIDVRKANAGLTKMNGWSVDYNAVADEVDAYNSRLCQDHGWTQYLALPTQTHSPPKSAALLQQEQSQIVAAAGPIRKIWSGIKTLDSWIDSGEPPVPAELSEKRAAICVACSKNTEGNFTAFFTKPAALAIQKQVGKLHDRNLSTPHDGRLNVCDVCLCPMKLKVHTPISYIKAHMIDAVMNELKAVSNCWIPDELAR